MSRNFIFCKSRTRSRFSSKGWAKRLGKQGQHTFRSECGVVEDAISPATACTNYQHNLAAGQKMLRPAWARAVLCRPGDAGNALFTVEERGLPIVCFLCFLFFVHICDECKPPAAWWRITRALTVRSKALLCVTLPSPHYSSGAARMYKTLLHLRGRQA